jgi:hypothetical protein
VAASNSPTARAAELGIKAHPYFADALLYGTITRSFFTALDVDGSQDSVSWVEMFNRLIERVSFRNNDRTTKHTDGTDPESTQPTKEDWKARAVTLTLL